MGDENKYRTITKEDIWRAFYRRRASFKRPDEEFGSLTEELLDAEDEVDWELIMEAFRVLMDQGARAKYENCNLAPHAKRRLVGLRTAHDAWRRDEDEKARIKLAELEAAQRAAAEAEAAAGA